MRRFYKDLEHIRDYHPLSTKRETVATFLETDTHFDKFKKRVEEGDMTIIDHGGVEITEGRFVKDVCMEVFQGEIENMNLVREEINEENTVSPAPNFQYIFIIKECIEEETEGLSLSCGEKKEKYYFMEPRAGKKVDGYIFSEERDEEKYTKKVVSIFLQFILALKNHKLFLKSEDFGKFFEDLYVVKFPKSASIKFTGSDYLKDFYGHYYFFIPHYKFRFIKKE